MLLAYPSSGYPVLHKSSLKSSARDSPTITQAIYVLSSLDQPPPIWPSEMALLVSGLLLVCCWSLLMQRIDSFDALGLHSLVEVWVIAVIAVVAGQIARIFTPEPPASSHAALQSELDAAIAAADGSSSKAGKPSAEKEGRESFMAPEEPPPGSCTAAAVEEEDMAETKRRAQAEAAAKVAQYRADLMQLLGTISQETRSGQGVRPQLLFNLADELFASPINLSEFVQSGGVPIVVAATESLLEPLAEQQQQPLLAQVLPALLQASWVVLQVGHGPPACRTALEDSGIAAVLLSATTAVARLPSMYVSATESILRNLLWTLLILLDPTHTSTTNSNMGDPWVRLRTGPMTAAAVSFSNRGQHDSIPVSMLQKQLLQGFADCRGVQLMQQLVMLQHGPSAGWLAAALLSRFIEVGAQAAAQQKQASGGPDTITVLSQSAVQAMLQPDSIAGLGYLLQHQQHQQQLGNCIRGYVEGQVLYLLSFHTAELLQLLIEGQLVGCFAGSCCERLGRLLVCQLLSSRGQEVMLAVEEEFELDVPLALAQIIPLKLHLKLPSQSQQQHQPQQVEGEIEPAAEHEQEEQDQEQEDSHSVEPLQASSCAVEDVYTDILASRLLLQHNRLWELLAAFGEEVLATEQQHQQGPSPDTSGFSAAAAVADAGQKQQQLEPAPPVVAAVLGLIHHLMSRDLELEAAKHMRGDSVDDSFSSTSSGSSSRVEAALGMPDTTGMYSTVMSGMVPTEQLPGIPHSSNTGLLAPPAAAAAADSTSAAGQVVFQFGQLQHVVSRQVFKQIKQCSKLVHSILCQSSSSSMQQQQVVTVLTIPHFTHVANLWVVQCLEHWLARQSLEGFTALQAAKLWVAADFLQVDELQVACENVLAAAFKADPAVMQVALELCARHTDSSNRLQRLLVQELLRGLGCICSTGGAAAAAAVDAPAQQQQRFVELLQQMLGQHQGLLLSGIHAELRDRLVAMCMLNAGLDADAPDEQVE